MPLTEYTGLSTTMVHKSGTDGHTALVVALLRIRECSIHAYLVSTSGDTSHIQEGLDT